MITPLLRHALDPVVARHRMLRRLTATVIGLCALAAVALAWPLASGGTQIPAPLLVAIGLIVCWRAAVWAETWNPDYRKIAQGIERQKPELHALLLTAVEQKPDPATGRIHFLQQRVIAEAAALAREQRWIESVPERKLVALRVAAIAAFIAVILPGFLMKTPPKARPVAAKPVGPKNAALEVEVSPGSVELERGTGLIVLATFHHDVPGEATLVIEPKGQPPQRIPLMKNLADPVFGGGLPEVDGDLTYRVEYAGKATADFSVKVFEHPRLERADATLRFPAYTKLPEKTVPDTRRVTAVEGTKLDVALALNKPVKSAALVAKDGSTIPLVIEPGQPRASLRDFPMQASQTYELKLEDADGRASKAPAIIALEAVPNRRPELKIAAPKGDQRVSPLQEVGFGATAWDDFGLLRYGLTVNVAGRGEQAVELGQTTKADEKREFAHLLKLEEVGVKPDELVSWYLWADDIGPDGGPRRTATDMFFAEVRPFEEIFRRGDDSQAAQQQQQQQQSAAGQQAGQMASSQKEIISATWNLKRAEEAFAGPVKPGEKYRQDEPVVRDAQAELLTRNSELAARVEDPKSAALLVQVKDAMQKALDLLKKAETTAEPLPEALGAEQAAYNALLKLAAHEFQVVRQQRQQGQQQGQQQSNQQQLDELEMKDEKQRYETKREAAPMQNEQQREQLAVLNRLKELAQRQQDVNERLKELQTQLQAAQTEKEKEELRRQLKRLREEEQQMLADMDETRQRMEQSPQQSEFAEQRQQLEQAREQAQQSAQAMEQGQTSQALASGTRTQRQLQEMRDELRKKTSGQFNDQLREMRTDARELAQNQSEIAEKLGAEPAKPTGRRSLDSDSEREQLAKELEKQRAALAELTENMKRVSDQAETAEPLLARELYDTLRKTTQAGTGETLANTETLAGRGFTQQAQRFEEKARAEIEELKAGVERAAESVLGDEAEALRQARAELDALTDQITRELARARPGLIADAVGGMNPLLEPREGQPGAEGAAPGSTRVSRVGGGVPPPRTSEDPQSGQSPAESEPSSQQGQQPGQGRGQTAGGGQGGRGGQQDGQRGAQRPGVRIAELANEPRQQRGGSEGGGGAGGPSDGEQAGPLTGDRFTEWSDRLRNVEEMIDDPALRTEAARIREAAKGVRGEFKRHSVEPNWDLVNAQIRAPLAELRDRVTEEIARRDSKENLVPIDRDPVPVKFAERVRRYYEDLGRSR